MRPKCPDCGWHMEFRIVEVYGDMGLRWQSFCWNPNCKRGDVRVHECLGQS